MTVALGLSTLAGLMPATARDACDGNWNIHIEKTAGPCDPGNASRPVRVEGGTITEVSSRRGRAFQLSGTVIQCSQVSFTITTNDGDRADGSGSKQQENYFAGEWRVTRGKQCRGIWTASRSR
jgi:hypothetical protein